MRRRLPTASQLPSRPGRLRRPGRRAPPSILLARGVGVGRARRRRASPRAWDALSSHRIPPHPFTASFVWARAASKAELKKIKKAIADKRKSGIECYTDEEIEAAGFLPEE